MRHGRCIQIEDGDVDHDERVVPNRRPPLSPWSVPTLHPSPSRTCPALVAGFVFNVPWRNLYPSKSSRRRSPP